MPKLKFTKSAIDKIPHTTGVRVDYFDTETPGLGLRVGAGSKTFFVKVDVRDPDKKTGYRTVRQTLGRYGELTLDQVRKEMAGYDDKDKGFIPGKRLEMKRGNVAANGSNVTLDDMLEAYFKEKKKKDGKTFIPAGRDEPRTLWSKKRLRHADGDHQLCLGEIPRRAHHEPAERPSPGESRAEGRGEDGPPGG